MTIFPKRILLVAICFFVVSCGDPRMNKFHNGFMQTCQMGGESESICECVAEEIEDEYSGDDLQEMMQSESAQLEFKKFANDAAQNCKD